MSPNPWSGNGGLSHVVFLFEIDLHQLTIKVISDDKIQVSLGRERIGEERRGEGRRGEEGRGEEGRRGEERRGEGRGGEERKKGCKSTITMLWRVEGGGWSTLFRGLGVMVMRPESCSPCLIVRQSSM